MSGHLSARENLFRVSGAVRFHLSVELSLFQKRERLNFSPCFRSVATQLRETFLLKVQFIFFVTMKAVKNSPYSYAPVVTLR
jgi:hypothetical protein